MPQRKFKLKKEELKWIRMNFQNYTTRQLYDQVMSNRSEKDQFQFTVFRGELYNNKLKKCDILRWTKKETEYLLENYKTKGNKDLVKELSSPGRKFKKKNIEKKMQLMGISRTKEEIAQIKAKAVRDGVYSKANYKKWASIKIQENARVIRIIQGRPAVLIKVNGVLIRYSRYRYQQLYGKISKAVKVYHRDMDPLNVDDDNLYAVSGRGLSKEDNEIYKKNCRKHIERLEREWETPEPVEEVKRDDNTGGKIPVRLNSRTIVYVSPGTNINALREQYQHQNLM